MYTARTLDGSVEDILNPVFRIINFHDSPHVILVSKYLRYAWPTLRSEDTDVNGVRQFIQANSSRYEQEHEQLTQNPDLESLHTPWRDTIYHQWNHVFYDVMQFLTEVNCSVGHFHPPSHDAFALKYSDSRDEKGAVLSKIWDTNVLLIPAYRASGVAIRATILRPNKDQQSEKDLATFDDSNVAEIWYVRSGIEVKFYIEGEFNRDSRGLAAVMACGILCTEHHEQEGEERGPE